MAGNTLKTFTIEEVAKVSRAQYLTLHHGISVHTYHQ